MNTAGVLLAAGEGSRFAGSLAAESSVAPPERHKLLVEFRGQPLSAWALAAVLSAPFDRVYMVTGAVDLAPAVDWIRQRQPEIPIHKLVVVKNQQWAAGQATSVALALETAGADDYQSVVIGLADQPLVPSSAWASVSDGDGPIVVATFDGVRRPPVKLERTVWDLVPRQGDSGARTLIRMRPELVSEVPCFGNPVDIDTVKDLRAWN